MALHIDPNPVALTQDQALTGWRRECCIELLGEGQARIYLRAVAQPSLMAKELHRGVLFHRVGAGFTDLAGCMAAAEPALHRLVATAVRQTPCRENLFAAVTYDRRAWEAVMQTLERWERRPHLGARYTPSPPPAPRVPVRQLSMLSRRSAHVQAAVA